VQVWWHKSISLASNQGTVMASFVLEAIKIKENYEEGVDIYNFLKAFLKA